jgi:hypothetical protein
VGIEDDEVVTTLREVVPDGQSRLPATDDHRVESLHLPHVLISASSWYGEDDATLEAIDASAKPSIPGVGMGRSMQVVR